MNKRIKNKVAKARREEIHALLDTVLDINGSHPRKRELTGNLPTVFMDFSGHTGMFYLNVHSRGWYPDESADFKWEVDAADMSEIKELTSELRARYL